MKRVHIQFFAQLKERAGCGSASVQTEAGTVEVLYRELSETYGLAMNWEHVKAARNDNFCSGHTEINDGDRIAFMPPMSGG